MIDLKSKTLFEDKYKININGTDTIWYFHSVEYLPWKTEITLVNNVGEEITIFKDSQLEKLFEKVS